jgi:hypothetical protein
MTPTVMIVEPDHLIASRLASIAQKLGANVVTRASFEEARRDIALRVPALLISHVKLGQMRGTHLAHAATLASNRLHAVVYGSPSDLALERDARRPRIFFERERFLPYALGQYLTATLPPEDRRDVRTIDRRTTFRGGRRATDITALRGPIQPASA